jgi:hypothetical protein
MSGMKNIQVIDGAMNCTYDIFSATEKEFKLIFENGTDIEFSSDAEVRIGSEEFSSLIGKLWDRRVDKKTVNGIHGTIFFGLDYKKQYYPTKIEREMILVI